MRHLPPALLCRSWRSVLACSSGLHVFTRHRIHACLCLLACLLACLPACLLACLLACSACCACCTFSACSDYSARCACFACLLSCSLGCCAVLDFLGSFACLLVWLLPVLACLLACSLARALTCLLCLLSYSWMYASTCVRLCR